MKIAIIGQKGIPANLGGVEKHVEDLSASLVEAGHDVYVYTRPNYTPKNKTKHKGVNLISLPNVSTKHLDAISHTFLACLDVSFRRKVDVIHFHSIGPSSLIWLVKILKPRTPIVGTFHTQCYYHKKWSKAAKMFLKFGERMICKLPEKTIAVSKVLRSYVLEKYEENAVYVPNGVNLNEKKEASVIKEKWGLEKGEYIVSVSRLVKHKGIHYLINAYKSLNTNKKLVIVGNSSYTDDYVRELVYMAKDDKNIIFTGTQSGEILNELFSNAYLFVQPSESEGLSIALLEALSYGLPVLVSDIPENKEVIEGNGFMFENKNVKDLEDNLRKLVENESLLHGIEEKAKKRVQDEYGWEKITENITRLYIEAHDKKKRKFDFVGLFKKRGKML